MFFFIQFYIETLTLQKYVRVGYENIFVSSIKIKNKKKFMDLKK